MAIENEERSRQEAEQKVAEFQERAKQDLEGAEMVERATRQLRLGVGLVLLVSLATLAAIAVKEFAVQPAVQAQSPHSQAPRATGITRAFRPGLPFLPVAADEASVEALGMAAEARDQAALERLARTGRAFEIRNGSRIAVLKRGFGHAQLRVLDGNGTGRVAWVPVEWVRAEMPAPRYHLRVDSNLLPAVPVVTDEKGFQSVLAASTRSGDGKPNGDMQLVILDLSSAGRLFNVPDETPVEVLQATRRGALVRVASGPHSGRSGWVFPAWVASDPE